MALAALTIETLAPGFPISISPGPIRSENLW